MKPDVLVTLALRFGLLSLLAIGGTNSILPDAHRVVVEAHRFMTDADFADLYVLAQAAPGPNVLFFGLLGWKAAGVLGAVVATLALVGPSCALTFVVSRVWTRGGAVPWRAAVQAGLAPVTVGLLLAAGVIVARASNHGAAAWAITALTTLVAATTRVNPLWLFAAAALLGLLGLL